VGGRGTRDPGGAGRGGGGGATAGWPAPDPVTGYTERFCTINEGQQDQMCSFEPYPTTDKIGKKRANARRVGSAHGGAPECSDAS